MSKLSVFHRQNSTDASFYDVYWILNYFLGVRWVDLETKALTDFPSEKVEHMMRALEAYHEGKPLAYILQCADFLDLSLFVKEGVLIPRSDTEPMVLEILKHLKGKERILELGVGSGAISCALASRQDVEIVGIDASPLACEVAKINVDRLGLADRVKIQCEDWYNDWDFGLFDWVVSNPPYIAKDDPSLSDSVKQYEPSSAWKAEDEGLADLYYIIDHAHRWLKPSGYIVLEHGFSQQEKVSRKLKEAGYSIVHYGKDPVHSRFLVATLL